MTPRIGISALFVAIAAAVLPAQSQETPQAEVPTPAVSTAATSPLPASGIPMRVFAVPFKGDGRNAAVVMAVEMDLASLDLREQGGALGGKVDIRYVATDEKQKVHPGVMRTAWIQVKPDSPGRVPLERMRVRVVSEFALPTGRYQVRVAAGAPIVGSNVVYDLEVPDFSEGPLAMSGVMLVAPSEPMVLTLNTKEGGGSSTSVKCDTAQCKAAGVDHGEMSLSPSLTAPLLRGGTAGSPTPRREFETGDQLMLVAEVYDNARRKTKGPPSVIALTADLQGSDGRVIPLASEEHPVSLLREGATGHAFKVYVLIPDVPGGEYALRVQARTNATEDRVVSREIALRVK